jgi:hypothetical protein
MKFRHKKLCAGDDVQVTDKQGGGLFKAVSGNRDIRKGSRCYFKVVAASMLQRGMEYTVFFASVHQKFINKLNNLLI